MVDGNLSVVNDDLAKSRQDAENLRLRYEAITASNEQLVADMEENRKALEQTRLKKESLEGPYPRAGRTDPHSQDERRAYPRAPG